MIVRRMQLEHSIPPYGRSGRLLVLGIALKARDSIAFMPCSKVPQPEQCGLLGLRALYCMTLRPPGVRACTRLNRLDLSLPSTILWTHDRVFKKVAEHI